MPVVIHMSTVQTHPVLSRDDTLARTGRLILRSQLEAVSPVDWCMQEGEQLTSGKVHRLRVTTRRLRSTLRVFRPYYKNKALQPILRGLRDLSGALTHAREQDVSLRALESYQRSADEEARLHLEPVLEIWRQEREVERLACAGYLGGERHAAWLRNLSTFVQSVAGDRPQKTGQPYYLRHVLDVLVDKDLAAVRVYDTLPPQPRVRDIHTLRIAVKRLRNLCETLKELLQPERSAAIIAACAQAQDDYGALVDAYLSAQRALRFVAERRAQYDDPQALRAILSFARDRQCVVNDGLAGWKRPVEPLFVL